MQAPRSKGLRAGSLPPGRSSAASSPSGGTRSADARIALPLRQFARPIEGLREDPKNARAHPDKNIGAIKDSLEKFGQQKIIVVARDGIVVAGNGTLRAAKALGWTELACVTTDLDVDAARAFAVADNRSAELAEWDAVALSEVIASLSTDLSGVLGFDDRELRRIAVEAEQTLRSLQVGAGDLDEVPELPAAPETKLGDLYMLGSHRLVCGSATDPAAVARVLDGAKPRLMVTDPPFGVRLDMEWRDRAGLNALGPAARSYMRGEGHKNTSISGDTRADWSEAYELVASLDTAYVWHASAFAVEVALGLRRVGFEIKQQLIWRKPHFALSRQHYNWQHEPIWYARKSGAAPFLGSRDQSTVWDAASPKMLMAASDEEKEDHPCQKPVALYVRPVENHLVPGECFYEPFAGSGTAVAAAEVTGRRCLAVELDPKFCDQIVSRWVRLTARAADVVRVSADGTERRGWTTAPKDQP